MAMTNKAPKFRVFMNGGNSGSEDIVDLNELPAIAEKLLNKMTPLGLETGLTLRIIRLKTEG